MRRLLSAFALVATSAATVTLAQSPPATPRPTEELYKTNCQMCHMPDGNAAIKQMNLADGEWIHGSDPPQIAKVIANGVPATAMMPFKDRLSPKEIEALAKYVRAFDKTLKPAEPATGKSN